MTLLLIWSSALAPDARFITDGKSRDEDEYEAQIVLRKLAKRAAPEVEFEPSSYVPLPTIQPEEPIVLPQPNKQLAFAQRLNELSQLEELRGAVASLAALRAKLEAQAKDEDDIEVLLLSQ